MLALSVCLLIASCVPIGLPETVARISVFSDGTYQKKVRRDSRAFVVLDDKTETYLSKLFTFENPKRRLLGSQFLFGFIPVTRLYFEHSIELLLLEHALSALSLKGYEWYVVSESEAVSVLREIPHELALSVAPVDVGITAFDLFLTRRVSISGDASIERVAVDESPVLVSVSRAFFPLAFSEFHTKPHAVYLSHNIQQSIKNGVNTYIPSSDSTLSRATPERDEKKGRLTFVPKVSVPEDLIEKGFGAELTASYGFNGLSSFDAEQISRIAQRATASGLRSLSTRAIETSASESSLKSNIEVGSVLFADIRAVEPIEDTGMLLRVRFLLHSLSERQVLAQVYCEHSISFDDVRDRNLLIAFESLVSLTTKDFFSGQNEFCKRE